MSLFAAGCVAVRPDEPNLLSEKGAGDFSQVYAETKAVPDPHAGWTEVLGPIVTQYGPDSRVRYLAFMRTRDTTYYGIQVTGYFPKRVYLGDAYSGGQKLESKVIDRERLDCGYGCTTAETVEIALSEAEMAQYAESGLELEVIGRRDDITVSIPASYLAGVLAFHRYPAEDKPAGHGRSRGAT